ncbi:MAG: methyltransferase domain-containing protein [Candidatus Magasanikbacteria bacterium]|nr:methyltransferase domain-containing protein [Candidatus Magasanikbacteria bacterium]
MWRPFFCTEKIVSEKNNLINIRKTWGSFNVMVSGYFQSGPYVTALWQKMLKRINPNYVAKNVLMLGLGGGDGLKVVLPKFKQAKIVTVEYDPKMVEIAERLIFKTLNYYPEVIIKDAEEALQQLVSSQRKFDVIIVDLFIGPKTSPLLYSNNFIKLLAQTLTPEGYLLVNFFKEEKELSPLFANYFANQELVRYKYNKMRIYRQKD